MKISREEQKRIFPLIFELREKGYTYKQISEFPEIQKTGYSSSSIGQICKSHQIQKGQLLTDTDIEIYSLRKEHKSYNIIRKILMEKGIVLSYASISQRSKRIFEQLGEPEPKAHKISKIAPDTTIIDLRDQENLTFAEIGKKLNLSKQNVHYRYQKMTGFSKKEELSDKDKDIIFSLREKGLTYKNLVVELDKLGICVPYYKISKVCKEIYNKKGVPEVNLYRSRTPESIELDNLIYHFRQQNMSYVKILKKLEELGIHKSFTNIRRRCKRIYKEKNEVEPSLSPKKAKPSQQISSEANNNVSNMKSKVSNKDLALGILNLLKTKHATLAQIRKIAEYYDVNLDEVFQELNNFDEPSR